MGDKEFERWEAYYAAIKSDDKETAKILKDALKIVDELAKIDIEELLRHSEGDEELDDLIKRAKKLKRNRLWKLK
jgi:hypothetical protein